MNTSKLMTPPQKSKKTVQDLRYLPEPAVQEVKNQVSSTGLKASGAKAITSPQKLQGSVSNGDKSKKSFAEGNRFSGFGVEVITGMMMVR